MRGGSSTIIGAGVALGVVATLGGCPASTELPNGDGAPAGESTTGGSDEGPNLTVGSLVTGLDTVGDPDDGSTEQGGDATATATGGSTADGPGDTDDTAGSTSGSDSGALPEHCGDTIPVAGADPLIDGLELEAGQAFPDHLIPEVDGRVGFWFTFNDDTRGAMQTPAPGSFQPTEEGADGSDYSARTFGEGFSVWGAGLAVSLNNDFGGNCPYDGSSYDGFEFWARGAGTVRFMAGSRSTVRIELGGLCDADVDECDDHHGVMIALTPEWTRHEIAWSDLAQQGWGEPADFDAAQLLELQWQTPENQAFDFSVDELRFWTAE